MAGARKTSGKGRLGDAYYAAVRLLPKARAVDRLVALIDHLRIHRRFPSARSGLFNDMLYGIKTSDEMRDPLRVFISDKEFVKLYVRAVVGEDYNVPTLDVLRSADEVDAYDFPESCCIKPTHASGRVILRRNGEAVDRALIRSWLKENYYNEFRELNYRYLKPKIIIEPILFQDPNILDYKFFCCNGVPKLIQVDFDRRMDHRRKFFDPEWNEQDFSIIYARAEHDLARPANLPLMLSLAAKLSAGLPFLRVDLYSDGTECFVGELTNCSENAQGHFVPPAAEARASRMIFGAPGDPGGS